MVEVVVAVALLCLVVAASYIGVNSASHAARTMSQRVSAQGMCITLFEEMKGCFFGALASSSNTSAERTDDPVAGKAAFLVAQGLGPGTSEVTLTYAVPLADDTPTRRNVHIVCTWKSSSFRGEQKDHTEELYGVLFDSFSTSGKKMAPLDVNSLALNPNYTSGSANYGTPAYLQITDTSGNVYTQNDMARMPSHINAVSVVVYPGGGGEQAGVYSNARALKINNGKTYAYYCTSDDNPISVTISSNGGKYHMNMYCAEASVNIE